jgi:pimeloyl-ACP methyl ester carboxylesterase
MKKNHFHILFMLLCLAFLMEACKSTQPAEIDLQSCFQSNFPAQCGTLSVFEDRATNSGRKIDIRAAVIKARGQNPNPDPIFWLAGGPGSAAIEDIPYAMQILALLNRQRDLVFVDQRGTGGSNKMVCPSAMEHTQMIDDLRACLTDIEGDPRAYTTAWAMDDLDDVRAALGYDRINLYGGSYGATAAQVYILRHGDHVRVSVVDGASLLDVPMFERYPISSQNALELVFVRCETDPDCQASFPNLRQEFAETIARLNQAPVTLPINDASTGQPLVATAEKFKTTIHNLLTSTPTTIIVPRFIHLVYSEDWSRLADLIASFENSSPESPEWKIMPLTILCHEDWAKMRPAETTAATAGSYLTYADVRELTVTEDVCAVMPSPKAEALYGPVTSSSVPLLLFNGEADPQDPPANAAAAKQRYPNSLSLVAPGQAHGFTGIPCRASIVADFIEHGTVEGLDTQCLESIPLPAFDLSE